MASTKTASKTECNIRVNITSIPAWEQKLETLEAVSSAPSSVKFYLEFMMPELKPVLRDRIEKADWLANIQSKFGTNLTKLYRQRVYTEADLFNISEKLIDAVRPIVQSAN